jgi:RNA polymerase sigma-70 factor (ECF subfamily)
MDRTTFELLLQEHRDAVYRTARYLVRNVEDAEDVVQETFVRLWKTREDIRIENVRSWLLRVCRNLCLDALRRRKVRDQARLTADQVTERGRIGIETAEDDGRDRSLEVSDLGTGALRTDLELDIEKLVRAMGELNEPQRSIILLREVQDLSYEEIAQTLDLSLSAVKVYLHRARKKIRAAFEEDWSGEAEAR